MTMILSRKLFTIPEGHYTGPKDMEKVPGVIEVWEATEDVNIPYANYIGSAKAVKNGNKNVINASKDMVFEALHNLTTKCYFRLRLLTPSECFRLMGVDEVGIKKLVSSGASGVSREQLVKQAGNAIVVDILFYLFKSVFTPGCDYIR